MVVLIDKGNIEKLFIFSVAIQIRYVVGQDVELRIYDVEDDGSGTLDGVNIALKAAQFGPCYLSKQNLKNE